MDTPNRNRAASGQRRQEILDAALQVFTEKGLMAATMEDIRLRSGASTGSIYHHFPGKAQLIAALYSEGYQDLHRAIRAAFDGGAAAAQGIRTIVDNYLGWFEARELLGRFLLSAAGTEYVAAAADAMRQDTIELEAMVVAWLRPFVARGDVAAMPEAMYVPLIIGPCREVIRRWQAGAVTLAAARGPLAAAVWRSLAAG